MLVRLLYASRARAPLSPAELDEILDTSTTRNAQHGITGVLCHGNGVFLQALEGDREAVSRLFHAIARDERHRDVVLLHYGEIDARDFAGWAMGYVNADKLNTATLLKYSAQGQLDPYRTCGAASLALVKELIAGASVVTRGPERARR